MAHPKKRASFSVKGWLFLLPAHLFTPSTALIHPARILEGNLLPQLELAWLVLNT